MSKKRLLIFHQALAPYRVDFWNTLNELFDLKLYFMYENLLDQKFDQQRLKALLNFEAYYIKTGITIGVRAFRWGFKSIINKFNPDIVFSYEYSQTTISLCIIKNIFDYKFKLYSMCDDSLTIAQDCSGIRAMLRGILLQKIDGLILVNQDVASWYKSTFGLTKQYLIFPIIAKEVVFRNGLNHALNYSNELLDQYELTSKKCVFFIGRIMPVKGIDRLIKAFSLVSDRHSDSVLVIIGDGEQLGALKEQVSTLKIDDQVLFPGRFEGADLLAWYNLAQVFVLASHYEPFGAVVNEALLSGSYVLCSKNAGASALIEPNVNGNIFAPFDVHGLSVMLSTTLDTIMPIKKLNMIAPSRMNSLFSEYADDLYSKLSNNIH